MMRHIAILSASLVGLTACVSQGTPEQQAEFAGNLIAAQTVSGDNRVVVATSTYVVQPNADRTVATVTPISGLQHNIDRMETAAAQFTGCTAKAQPQVYDLMRGSAINAIPQARIERFGGQFPIGLTC